MSKKLEWKTNTGSCPVEGSTKVYIRMHDEDEDEGEARGSRAARTYQWGKTGAVDDIVYYAVG